MGDPVPPRIVKGAAVRRKSQRFRVAAASVTVMAEAQQVDVSRPTAEVEPKEPYVGFCSVGTDPPPTE
jgi:hypothetical protein